MNNFVYIWETSDCAYLTLVSNGVLKDIWVQLRDKAEDKNIEESI